MRRTVAALEARARGQADAGAVARAMLLDVTDIDAAVTAQLNAVLSHERFAAVERAWRSVWFLVHVPPREAPVQILLINTTWERLADDAEESPGASWLHRVLYTEGIDQPGAQPYSLVIADFFLRLQRDPHSGVDDQSVIRHLADVGARALTPVLIGVAPQMFRIPGIHALQRPSDLALLLERGEEFIRWRQFRAHEDSRFLALVFPRVLLRDVRPTGPLFGPAFDGAAWYHGQEPSQPNARLWGNGAYSVAAVLVESFVRTGWFNDARVLYGHDEPGRVPAACPNRPLEPWCAFDFPTVEVSVPPDVEHQLNRVGVITITPSWPSNTSVVRALPTAHLAQSETGRSLASAIIGSTLNHMLSACRISHWLRRATEGRVAGMYNELEIERALENVLQDTRSADRFDRNHPLRNFAIRVRQDEANAGEYLCDIELAPWVEPERVESRVHLQTFFRGGQA